MAKFVLAGRADCPYYAKAELLADYLQKNLPNFRIYKITQHPDNWEKWLQETCEKNGWKHKRSPIIWRELLDRGGKGLLLGGFNEFLEHAQHYYNITSDMVTAEMQQIAKENLQAHIQLEQEEEELKGLINPIHIWINRAAGPVCYHLIPLLLNGEIFGAEAEVSLHLLDRSSCEGSLRGIVMETEDMAYPLLRSVTLHTDLEGAFHQADVIILLDDILLESIPTLEDCIRLVTSQCEAYGPLIDKNAKKDVRIVVMGRTFSNLKALMLMMNAPSINPRNIVTVAMLECEAKAMLARKLKMLSAGIKNLVIWGNASGSSFIDLNHTELYRYDSAIWGPPNFFRPLLDVLFDREWMRSQFVASLSTLSSWGHHCLGMAPAHIIATVLRYWYHDSPPKEMISLGVISEGQFGIPEGIVFSMPVRFQNGRWEALTELEVSKTSQDYLQILAHDLIREKAVALGEANELYPQRRVPRRAVKIVAGDSSPEELEMSSIGQVPSEEPSTEVPKELPEVLKESQSPEEENIEEPTEDVPEGSPYPETDLNNLEQSA
ncbi:putative malate dehydrogenase 1B isoform X1 [Paroedura picta]|uniref:putative malate dehydrogenase 1B isoform X1 n=1 Tax=Paroedura picta TaxID=143630 RepID=UPI004057C74D